MRPLPLIAPSILSADFCALRDELSDLERGGADYVHVDVMDGHFVPNLTIGPPVVASIRKATTLSLDCHLMMNDPDRYLDAFVTAGADIITVHAEAVVHLQRTVSRIRTLGKRAGVALNPHTSEEVLRYLLDDIDLVLIMSVNPGFGGQAFLSSMLEKVARVAELIDKGNRPILLEVDGGITTDNAETVGRAGANLLVAGAAVLGQSDRAQAITAIRQAAVRGFCSR